MKPQYPRHKTSDLESFRPWRSSIIASGGAEALWQWAMPFHNFSDQKSKYDAIDSDNYSQ